MSNTIDEKVVSMQFDNSDFEKNVSTSMGTLEKLKQSLNFSGAEKGLEDINSAVKGVDVSSLGSGIETVKAKFSALQVVAVSALNTITSSAVNAGLSLAKSLSIDQITAGFDKFSSKTQSVATLVAQGYELEQVNKQLDYLNLYTDETSYNFTEMVANIAKFTATGKGLEESVVAMEGIANWAALSGQNAATASRAMYQLSQAMGAGVMRLEDYRSIQNASMDTQEFRQQCIAAAISLGTLKDNGDGTYSSLVEDASDAAFTVSQFAKNLTEGAWLTSDVMMDVYSNYAAAVNEILEASEEKGVVVSKVIDEIYDTAEADGLSIDEAIQKLGYTFDAFALKAFEAAQKARTFTDAITSVKDAVSTAWMKTFELLFGNAEQATELWTDLSEALYDVFAEPVNNRNDILSDALLSNWEKLTTEITDAGISAEEFEEKVTSVAQSHNVDVQQLIQDYGSLEKAIKAGAISSTILGEAVHGLEGTINTLENVEVGLGMGKTGEDVKEVQTALESLGYELEKYGVDGIYGKETTAAVKAFQEASGIEITGIIDEATLNALKEASQTTVEFSDNIDDLINNVTELGGRENLVKSFWNVWEAIGSVMAPIKEAFREIFPATTAEQIYEFTKKLLEFTEGLTLSEDSAEKLKSTFKGLFAGIDIGVGFIKKLASGIITLLSKFTGLGSSILGATSSFGDLISGLRDTINETDIFGIAIDKVVWFLGLAIDKVKEFFSSIKGKVESSKFDGLLGVLSSIWEFIKILASDIANVAKNIAIAFSDAFQVGDLQSALGLFNSGILSVVLLKIKNFFTNINAGLTGFENMMDRLTNSITIMQDRIQVETLKQLAIAIAILAGSLLLLSMINQDKLNDSIFAITALFTELAAAIAIIKKTSSSSSGIKSGLTGLLDALSLKWSMDTVISFAAAIAILAGSLWLISKIDSDKLQASVTAITDLILDLLLSITLMSQIGNVKGIDKACFAMILMSVAIAILASTCKSLSSLEWDEIIKGLTSIGVLMTAVTGALIAFSKLSATSTSKLGGNKKGFFSEKSKTNLISFGIAMIAVAAAMKIFASAAKDFGQLDWGELAKAGAAMAGILVAVGLFSKFAGTSSVDFTKLADGGFNAKTGESLIKMATALVVIAASMKIFASAASDFGQLDWEQLGKAGAALAGILLAIGLFAKFAASSKSLFSGSDNSVFSAKTSTNLLQMAAALLIISAAMEIFADVCSKFGEMKWDELGKAGAAMAGILALSAGFAYLAGLAKGDIIASSAALLIMAAAVNVFAPAFERLGEMKFTDILKGLFAMAAAFTVMALAGAVLEPFIPAILLLSAAIALFGVGCLAAGAGITLLATSIGAFAIALAANIASIMASIVTFIEGCGQIMVALCQAFIEAAPSILEAIFALLELIGQAAPQIAETAFQLLINVLDMLIEYGPQIFEKLFTLIVGFLDFLTGKMPELIESIGNFIVSVINGLAEKVPDFVEAGIKLFGAIVQGISESIGPIIENIIGPLIESFGQALASVLEVIAPYIPIICEYLTTVITTIGDIVECVCNLLTVLLENISPIIDSITNLIQQLGDTISHILQSIEEILTTTGTVICDIFQSICDVITTCGDTITQVLDGLSGTFSTVFDSIAGVITSIGESINSVLSGIADIISSIGEAALDAGTGFENLASGVKTITELKLADMVASLGALAVSLGEIAAHSAGLAEAGAGMQQISTGATLSADAFDAMVVGVGEITSTLTELGPKTVAAMSTFSSAISSAVASTMQAAAMIVQTNAVVFINSGMLLMANLNKGILSGSKGISYSISSSISKAVSSISSYYNSFYSAGSYLVTGFANGISANTWRSTAKAVAMAQAAITAAKETLQINSPSKIFRWIGSGVPEGFAQGIERSSWMAEDSVTGMAENALSATKKAILKISNILDSDIDSQPTIRPVLDLTSISDGVGVMNNMLSGAQSVSVLSDLGAISYSMNSRNQNGTNDDVISAIKDLGNKINESSGDTYQINGITYDDGSNISDAVRTLIRAARVERRV